MTLTNDLRLWIKYAFYFKCITFFISYRYMAALIARQTFFSQVLVQRHHVITDLLWKDLPQYIIHSFNVQSCYSTHTKTCTSWMKSRSLETNRNIHSNAYLFWTFKPPNEFVLHGVGHVWPWSRQLRKFFSRVFQEAFSMFLDIFFLNEIINN